MLNYVNYFTEIEERFQQRRGSLLMLSTLDWALIDTWREAQIPLEAVLRGIDDAFDKHEVKKLRSKGRTSRVNGLAWVAQSVMQAAESATEAAIGMKREAPESGFETARIAAYLHELTAGLEGKPSADSVALRLRELAQQCETENAPQLEELDRVLSALEERMLAGVVAATPEQELVALREQAAREIAPYRGKMQAAQIKQVQQQFVHKRLLEARGLPRLSLFYMRHE